MKCCIICLERNVNYKYKRCPTNECKYVCHDFCLKKWLYTKNICPICKCHIDMYPKVYNIHGESDYIKNNIRKCIEGLVIPLLSLFLFWYITIVTDQSII